MMVVGCVGCVCGKLEGIGLFWKQSFVLPFTRLHTHLLFTFRSGEPTIEFSSAQQTKSSCILQWLAGRCLGGYCDGIPVSTTYRALLILKSRQHLMSVLVKLCRAYDLCCPFVVCLLEYNNVLRIPGQQQAAQSYLTRDCCLWCMLQTQQNSSMCVSLSHSFQK